jgi:hypothetical protein
VTLSTASRRSERSRLPLSTSASKLRKRPKPPPSSRLPRLPPSTRSSLLWVTKRVLCRWRFEQKSLLCCSIDFFLECQGRGLRFLLVSFFSFEVSMSVARWTYGGAISASEWDLLPRDFFRHVVALGPCCADQATEA